ncbi:MAG: SDR family oxidoreductase [Candidatus Sericytochromatia bacterium]
MVTGRTQAVVITGASAGVGRATAREFAKEGARIGLLARGREGLEAAKREVEELGGEAIALVCDVSDPDQVEEAADAVEEAFGAIDVWVNNAMVTVFSPVKETTPADYKRVTDVTYLGYVHGTLAALKRMLPRDRGTIIQVGSALAYRAIPLQSAYCAAKHAIKGFTESLRTELMHDGSRVHVTAVHLPAVNTPQFTWAKSRMPYKAQPVPPIFQPEVPARAIVWASHHRRREIWVGAPVFKAMVGEKVAPEVADEVLARSGYNGQMLDRPEDPDRENNLYVPLPGDHGAHGPFDDRARDFSPVLWADTHRAAVALAGAGVLALAALAIGTRRSA